jgi:molybdate-binding protein/DNA-binding XRE family transcriptional regulator
MANGIWNRVRETRERLGWTQDVLAARAGLSRAEISAIETGRVVPSTAAGLALSRAMGARLEDLFGLADEGGRAAEWAWPPGNERRYWLASVEGGWWRYPVEPTASGVLPHDGVWNRAGHGAGERAERSAPASNPEAGRTLVIAGCDPSMSLLAHTLARAGGIRVLAFVRSSARALSLLRDGRVHVAGVHLGEDAEGNAVAARSILGERHRRVHVARWTEGLALAPGLGYRTIASAVRARLRWVGREEGSGARRCMDMILEGRRRPEGAKFSATDHRGVVETIRSGWAQAGVCVQLAAQEGRLDFLPARQEDYDLCFLPELEQDPRITVLLDVVRSREYARLLGALPGYDVGRTGELA